MKGLGIAVLVVVVALAQVTVAPLFPISGAVPELGLLLLLLLGLFLGPGPVMAGLPALAILQGFATDRAPGLLIIAYLPLLPFAAALEDWRVPLWEYPRAAIAFVVAGLWFRGIVAFASIAQGADPAFGALAVQVMAPGVFLDLALLTVAYLPLRFLGWGGQRLSLQGSRY
jgi:predicted small integral membrane protein